MSMFKYLADLFRFAGDALLIASRLVVIKKITETKSVSGLSLQTQFIYLATIIFRYIDVIHFHSTPFSKIKVYNTIMKFLFLSYQLYIIFLMLYKYKNTYSRKYDNFNIPVLFIASAVISVFVKGETSGIFDYLEEYLYTNSLILESVAILPQLVMIQEAGDCESLTSHYIFLLGLYRMVYVFYFISKKMSGSSVDSLLIVTGLIQTGLYIEFFRVYYKYVMSNAGYGFSMSNSFKASL
jgi:ER lumen protein retaining receptor